MSALVEGAADAAAEHEALLSFLYLAPVGLVQFDRDGRVRMINPRSAQLLMPLARSGDLDNLYEALELALPDLRTRVERHTGRPARICDGLRLPLPGAAGRTAKTLSLTVLSLDDGSLMAVFDDVTEQVRNERLVQQSQSVINALLCDIDDYALVTLDADGRVARCSPALQRVTGWTAADVRGRPFDVFDGDDGTAAMADAARQARRSERLRDAERDGWSLADGWQRRADGSRFWGTTLVVPTDFGDGDGRGWHLVIRDIDDRRGAAQDLLRAMHTDFLTGVLNRRAFVEAAEREMARARRAGGSLSVALLDADHFKRVNDMHGHATGDAVLKHLASAMQAALRHNDVIARTGGEEFALLLPGLAADDACAAVQRLLDTIAATPLAVGSVSLRQTLSAGIAIYGTAAGADGDGASTSLDTLLERADRALYAAKAAGRNTVCRWHAQTATGLP